MIPHSNKQKRDFLEDYSTFKGRNTNCQDILTSRRPFSIKRSHLQTYPIGDAAVTDCVRSTTNMACLESDFF